jgi:hypothetical protein
MNLEWIITGMILFVGMTAAGISLYVKRRRESQISDSPETTETQSDFDEEPNR